MNSSIKVMLWDEEIGRLSWDSRRKTTYFTYNPEYVSKGLELAHLTAPIKGGNILMPVWGESGRIYQKLPAFLADSLPDSWGNQLFDLWARTTSCQARHYSVGETLIYWTPRYGCFGIHTGSQVGEEQGQG